MNKILYSKTPRQLASEIIAVFGFILLSISFKAIDITDCNAGELLHQIQTMQGKLPQKTLDCSKMQIMHKVIRNYDYLNEQLKGALDTIWENEAGQLLLRSFYQNMNGRNGLIIDYISKRDKLGHRRANEIVYDESTIYINFEKMERTFYIGYIHGVPDPVPFKETLDAMLFHEILHGYHNLLGLGACERMNQHGVTYRLHWPKKSFYLENLLLLEKSYEAWTDDEEVHTISGWIIGIDGRRYFDCLNTNTYMVLQALKSGISPENIVQRLFHCDYGSLTCIDPELKVNAQRIIIPLTKFS